MTLESKLRERAPTLLNSLELATVDSLLSQRMVQAILSTQYPVVYLTRDNFIFSFDSGLVEVTAPCHYLVRDELGRELYQEWNWGWGLSSVDRELMASVRGLALFYLTYYHNEIAYHVLVLFHGVNQVVEDSEPAPLVVSSVPSLVIRSSVPFDLYWVSGEPNTLLVDIREHPRVVSYTYEREYGLATFYPRGGGYLLFTRVDGDVLSASCSHPRWYTQGNLRYVAIDTPASVLKATLAPNLDVDTYRSASVVLEVTLA